MELKSTLSCRLSRAGIVATLSCRPQAGGGLLVGFHLIEMEDAERAERVPGAAADRSAVAAGGDGWLDRWLAEVERADRVVCAHFDITERHTFVDETSGHVILHVFRGQRAESVRWIHGLGWCGW